MTDSPIPASRDDDDDDVLELLEDEAALRDAGEMIVAGLLGAALGAGLGWLASRRFGAAEESPPRRPRPTERETPVARVRATATVNDVAAVARRAASALEQSRVDLERQLERGLRDLRRAARRAARRVG